MNANSRGTIVLKLSGEALGGARPLNGVAFGSTVREVRVLVEEGFKIGVVPGGGNIHRGGEVWGPNSLSSEDADWIGMQATGINAKALESQMRSTAPELRVHVVAKPGPVAPLFEPWTHRTVNPHTDADVVIVAGGTGVGGVSTDLAAPQLARDLGARRIVMSKFGVDGIYSEDPRTAPETARFLRRVTVSEALSMGLRFMDHQAMNACQELGITVHVVPAAEADALSRLVLNGEDLGSVLVPDAIPQACGA